MEGVEPRSAEREAGELYSDSPWSIRREIAVTHEAWLEHVASPGTWWNSVERGEFVGALWAALDDSDERPPWHVPQTPHGALLPAAAHAMAYRLARHAHTTTAGWYESTVDALGRGPAAFVELAALASTGCSVAAFGPALGIERPELLAPRPGEPTRVAPPLVGAAMNWVPVVPPADERAAVVQAMSAVPAEFAMAWRLGGVQYMPLEEMVDPAWRRPGSPFDRRQLELVATRLSAERECFY